MNYIYPLIASLIVGVLYNRYKHFETNEEEKNCYFAVQKYLVNTTDRIKSKKPILWVHMKYDVNARWWSSFYSRNSTDLNQPYLYLTIKSIIDTCGQDFQICLIDDDSFDKLMPNWTVNISLIADPIKPKIRELALAKLLYQYGGFLVPPSFICFQSLLQLYNYYTTKYTMFVGELLNKTTSSSKELYLPNTMCMGCIKESQIMLEYVNYLEHIISQDFVEESNILGAYGQWCKNKIIKGEMGIITADVLGVKDADGTAINFDRLVQNTYINLSGNVVGLYIPDNEIINRTAYNWFARLSAKQVLESDTIIGKYLLITH